MRLVPLTACLVLLALATAPRADAPWDLPPGVPPPAVPDPQALTPARIALGRQLFYDVRLSASGQLSCGTCHRREFAFTDARPLSRIGEPHAVGSHNRNVKRAGHVDE